MSEYPLPAPCSWDLSFEILHDPDPYPDRSNCDRADTDACQKRITILPYLSQSKAHEDQDYRTCKLFVHVHDGRGVVKSLHSHSTAAEDMRVFCINRSVRCNACVEFLYFGKFLPFFLKNVLYDKDFCC